jgi:isopenicillin N synthase-like dioxygenase
MLPPKQALAQYGYGLRAIPERIISLTKELDGAWEAFIHQPLKVKQKHVFLNGVGYEYRGPDELDYKETFHVVKEYTVNADATSADREYVRTAQGFIEETDDFAKNLIGSLLGRYGYDEAFLSSDTGYVHLLRSIHYFPRTVDQIMQQKIVAAASHIDQGVTIHWCQTNDGLQIFWEGEWRTIVHPDDVVVFYMGLLGQLYSECEFIAVCHRAVATTITKVIGRRVHVSFISFGGWWYDKSIWGSTQKTFPLGENYSLSKTQFRNFFLQGKKNVH